MGKSGRLVVPAKVRRRLGIEDGDEVILRLDEEGLHISTPAQALARAQAYVKSLGVEGRDLTGELLAERRREAAEEGE
jgi:AbrB family looped-hinge helix DNA binding protein